MASLVSKPGPAFLAFSTFHTQTAALPPEVTTRILLYAEPCTALLGHPAVHHPPIAMVSGTLRTIYLGLPSRFDFGVGRKELPYGPPLQRPGRRLPPDPRDGLRRKLRRHRPRDTHPTIGEALNFPDLQALARFFTHGPGRPQLRHDLAHITYIRVAYRDDWAVPPWWEME